ncbi:unnamed protein product [Sphacelaria rigidula]
MGPQKNIFSYTYISLQSKTKFFDKTLTKFAYSWNSGSSRRWITYCTMYIGRIILHKGGTVAEEIFLT